MRIIGICLQLHIPCRVLDVVSLATVCGLFELLLEIPCIVSRLTL